MPPIFQFDRVTKSFDRRPALSAFSLTAQRGTAVALLGANGCGKSTALRVLLGLEIPDAGLASVFGLDSRRHGTEIRRRVGYVSERPPLDEWMTVAETGWFSAGFYPDGYLPQFQQAARALHLPETQKVATLSQGMRAKLALALALAHRPRLLVLDEPTSSLDAAVRGELLSALIDAVATGQTVLFTTHHIDEAERVADVVAILHGGRLVACGPLDELKADFCELAVTTESDSSPLPPVDADVLWMRRSGRHCRMLVRGFPRHRLPSLCIDRPGCTVHLRPVSLQEIVAALTGRPQHELVADTAYAGGEFV